jgi:hypothetical protein
MKKSYFGFTFGLRDRFDKPFQHDITRNFYEDIVIPLGYEPEEGNLIFDLEGPKGESRRFDTSRLYQPDLITDIPSRFDFYGFSELLEDYRIVEPSTTNHYMSHTVFSITFFDFLRSIGFKDFIQHPARVYFVDNYDNLGKKFVDIDGHFPYRDDLYAVLQLITPIITVDSENPLSEYPLFFRGKYRKFAGSELFVNAIAAEALINSPLFDAKVF